jgi:hypothetical protein
MKMEEVRVRVIHEKEEYEIGEQELDRIIAIASKRLRDEVVAAKLGIGYFSKASFKRDVGEVRVMKDGYESEFYKAMSEALIYAIENGDLDSYKFSAMPVHFVKVAEPQVAIDRTAINNFLAVREQPIQDTLLAEVQKIFSLARNSHKPID